jgi:hypothetical protein
MLLYEFMTTGMFPVNYSGKIAGKKKFNHKEIQSQLLGPFRQSS